MLWLGRWAGDSYRCTSEGEFQEGEVFPIPLFGVAVVQEVFHI